MSLIATMQNQASSSISSYSGPYLELMQVANGVTLAGQMLDVTAVLFALFLMASLRVAARPHRLWVVVPLIFASAGGACFVTSFLMSSWVLQSFEVFLALAITTVACVVPGIIYSVVHR